MLMANTCYISGHNELKMREEFHCLVIGMRVRCLSEITI
jgi:hypothetical protein